MTCAGFSARFWQEKEMSIELHPRNLGTSPMCDLAPVVTSPSGKLEIMEDAKSKPPTVMWGGGVIEKFRQVNMIISIILDVYAALHSHWPNDLQTGRRR